MKKHTVVIYAILVILLMSVSSGFAQWVAPGKLTKSHEKLEGLAKCFKCHSLTQKIADSACRECHEKLNERINARKGYHADVKGDCDACHTDHKGEDFDITGLDKDAFDHDLTGYKLKDKHKLDCDKCHKKEKTYLDLTPVCNECHTDVHQKALSEDCIKCHSFKGWKDLEIDHNKDAAYRLTGKHIEVKCELCHPRYTVKGKSGDTEKTYEMLKFKPLEYGKCNDCHTDVHKGKLKQQTCTKCHITKDWKEPSFDHNDPLITEYKLSGKHEKAACGSCHPEEKAVYTEKGRKVEKLALKLKPIKYNNCTDCHYDIHKGQFKKQKCDACHSLQDGWKQYTFRHESKKYRGYKLEGKHKDVTCEKCHKRSEVRFAEFNSKKQVSVGKFKPFETGKCDNCHYDVHKGQFKERRCGDCHTEDKEWRDSKFDHESEKESSYKIEGKHKEVKCEQCHNRSEIRYTEFGILKKSQMGKFKPIKSAQCNDCHKDDHKGKYKDIEKVEGVTCDNCHFIEKDWKEYVYKHKPDSTYSRYNPEGQIKESNCEACHICDSETFCLTCCFERMGLSPLR